MFYNIKDNTYIQEGQDFTIQGISYPSQTLNQTTKEQKDSLGLVEVTVEGSFKNPKFYFNTEELDKGVRKIISTPRPLDSTKESLVAEINQRASSILSQSDWQVTKAFETGNPIPEEIAKYRKAIRELSNKYIEAVNKCKKISTLEKEVEQFDWDV